MSDMPKIEDAVVFIVQPDHPRFGQMARPSMHDWMGDGTIYVTFPDETTDQFADGLMSNHPQPPQALIIPKYDQFAIEALMAQLSDLRYSLGVFYEIAADPSEDPDKARQARQAFRTLLFSLVPTDAPLEATG